MIDRHKSALEQARDLVLQEIDDLIDSTSKYNLDRLRKVAEELQSIEEDL